MTDVLSKRCAGVFLHPTSLPSRFGVGDLGDDAYRWLDTLARYKQLVWQICPLGPTGYGHSPYNCLSSFAGNAVLISPRRLYEEGLLEKSELDSYPLLPDSKASFDAVKEAKGRLFAAAHERFRPGSEFDAFCAQEADWLDDYALFMVVKELNNLKAWYEWAPELRDRTPGALADVRKTRAGRIHYYKFVQFTFRKQWEKLRNAASEKGVSIMGDIPYYVAYDSCDAWAAPDQFEFDAQGKRKRMGGVPPDFFSADGQLWGNPIYRWKVMSSDGYAWWLKRVRKTLALVDVVRIDHFRGFEAFWAVPAGSKNARKGTWVKGPGIKFFRKVEQELGVLPFVAEDLGLITDDVRELLAAARLPGMKVLQFAFDKNPRNPYLPYNIPANSVVYTGTHDNDTSLGWFRSLPDDTRDLVRLYMGCDDSSFLDYFLRLALASPARLCLVPFQDVLGLDSAHRFNTPGTGEGNWEWRFTWDMVQDWKLERMEKYTELYGRGERKEERAGDAGISK